MPDLSFDEWNAIVQGFVGESMQVPPMYSALKQDGKRLYELARKGETVERKARPIRIDAIELLEVAGPRLVFRVTCSKGTYVRTLVEDIARKAGTVGHTTRLHRESVGPFRSEDMQDLMRAIEAGAEADLDGLRAETVDARCWPLAVCRRSKSGPTSAERFCAAASRFQVDAARPAGVVRVYLARP